VLTSRTLIATNDSQAAGLLEREGLTVRLFGTVATLLDDPGPGQVAILTAAELTPQIFERLHERSLPVPVLVLKTQGDPGLELPALLEAGADAVISWPAEVAVLKAWAMALLRQRRRSEAFADRQRELEDLARKDGLTGLFNYRWLKERLSEEFRRAQRHGDPLSLLMIDLDEFKAVNDRLGHPFGDRVLRVVSELITRSVRETDLCARYGGEEFTVLLPRTGLNGALTVADRIWQGTLESLIDGEKIRLSLGVSVGPTAQLRSADLLLRAADEALYRAKREGRNRICIDPQTQLRARDNAPTA
jgi:two-component system, cell cycle response regulator